MSELPTGTVTFLLTDVEDSTRLWDEDSVAMETALTRHDDIVRASVSAWGGVVHGPRGEGDSHFSVFTDARSALAAATEIQLELAREDWPTQSPMRVRIGLHTGNVDLKDGDYYGSHVNRCARLRGLAQGGQTLVSNATEALVGVDLPADISLRDLGTYKLRGLKRPERVFQLSHPRLPETFPPPGSDVVSGNLPLQLTSFVGRQREVRAVDRLLRSDRLVTLTGTGGSGKTRLALRIAESSASRFPDGTWFVDLTPLRDPDLVPQAVASALRVAEESGLPLMATLSARLSDWRALIVLDNCEHLIGAAAEVVFELLRSCPEIRVLATSREVLGVVGEASWAVPPLELPTDGVRARPDAVLLFFDRARLGDEIPDDTLRAVNEICRRVDGLPLGIELAASTTRVLPVEEIAKRISDHLDLPAPIERTREARHRTLEAAVEWSHELLTEDEQVVFRRLAAFSSGFSLSAAQYVCVSGTIQREDVLQLLSRLVEKSLLTVARGVADEPRYRLLETVRVYASSQLASSGEEADVRARQLRYFTDFVEEVSPQYVNDEPALRSRRIDEELDNIRTALAYARAHDVESGIQIVGALGVYWATRSYHSEGRSWCESFLEVAPAEPSPSLGRAVDFCGNMALHQGDGETCLARYAEGAAMGRRLGPILTAAWLAAYAMAAETLYRPDLARPAAAEALTLAREIGGPPELIAWALLARTGAQGLNKLDGEWLLEVRAIAEELVGLGRDMDLPFLVAYGLEALAQTDLASGDLVAARAHRSEELTIWFDWGWMSNFGDALSAFGELEAAGGEFDRAVRLVGAAAALSETFGYTMFPSVRARQDRWLDEARRKLGQKAAAVWAQGRALSAQEAVDYALGRREIAAPRRSAQRSLTRRELEVATLLTSGLTNRQIAEQLVLSERTVDAHVEHIRNKLGLRTRAQIAVWVTEEKLGSQVSTTI